MNLFGPAWFVSKIFRSQFFGPWLLSPYRFSPKTFSQNTLSPWLNLSTNCLQYYISTDHVIVVKSLVCEETSKGSLYNECKLATNYSKPCGHTISSPGGLNIGYFRSSIPVKAGSELLSNKVNTVREQYQFKYGKFDMFF